MEKVYPYTITEQEIFENIFTHKDILMNHVVVPRGNPFRAIQRMLSSIY